MLNRKFAAVAIAAASLGLSVPASAATLVLTGNAPVTGADANFLKVTLVDGAFTVNVRVTAWSVDANGIVRDSYLGAYGNGLGVTSGDENGQNNTHVVDNQYNADKSLSRTDFLLFQFDKDVSLQTANFTAFSVGGQTDTDATIAAGHTNINYMTQLALNDQAASTALFPLFSKSATSLGTSAGGTRNINPDGWVGNLWLISADFANKDKTTDGFKLSNVKFQTAGVPEPSTWAMMIAGFGLVGFGMRRRASRRNVAIA